MILHEGSDYWLSGTPNVGGLAIRFDGPIVVVPVSVACAPVFSIGGIH